MSSKALNRRRWLLDAGAGFGWLAVSSLLQGAGQFPHFAPRAERIIPMLCRRHEPC